MPVTQKFIYPEESPNPLQFEADWAYFENYEVEQGRIMRAPSSKGWQYNPFDHYPLNAAAKRKEEEPLHIQFANIAIDATLERVEMRPDGKRRYEWTYDFPAAEDENGSPKSFDAAAWRALNIFIRRFGLLGLFHWNYSTICYLKKSRTSKLVPWPLYSRHAECFLSLEDVKTAKRYFIEPPNFDSGAKAMRFYGAVETLADPTVETVIEVIRFKALYQLAMALSEKSESLMVRQKLSDALEAAYNNHRPWGPLLPMVKLNHPKRGAAETFSTFVGGDVREFIDSIKEEDLNNFAQQWLTGLMEFTTARFRVSLKTEEDGCFKRTYYFTSLLAAIYAMFYEDITQGTLSKNCANGNCKKLFIVNPQRTQHRYCSASCQNAAAQRRNYQKRRGNKRG